MDYRKNQRLIATLSLKDGGQDFTELDVLENGVLLGNSPMFHEGRITCTGIGSPNGVKYDSFDILKPKILKKKLTGMYVYFKNSSNSLNPVPWEAMTFKYPITGVRKPEYADRFMEEKV